MSTTATAKQRYGGHFLRPHETFTRHRGVFAAVLGTIANFSQGENECNYSHRTFAEKLNCGRATIARAISKLKKCDDVEIVRRGSKGSKYTYVGEVKEHSFKIKTEYYLYFHLFDIDGEERTLHFSEVDILSLIITCTNWKGEYTGSTADISQMLGISERTVGRTILQFIRAGLIFREVKGVNLNKKSKLVANMKLFRKLHKIYNSKKSSDEPTEATARSSARAAVVEEKTRLNNLREIFYTDLKKSEEWRVDQLTDELCLKSPRFKEATLFLRTSARRAAELELSGDVEGLNRLKEDRKRARYVQMDVLREFGYPLDSLKKRQRCSRCSDTGKLSDGKLCDCFPGGKVKM